MANNGDTLRASLEQAESFLNSNGSTLHPALAKNAGVAAAATSSSPFRNRMVELYTEDFQQAIEQYQHSSDDPKIRALDIRGEHSWERAVKKAREAEEKYSEGGQGRWRKLGRRLTEKSAAALPVAASSISSKKEEVLKALLRIPFVIVQADDCCETFGRDPVLLAKAENVYIAALAAIEGTTKWLSSNSAAKSYKAVLRGPLYNKSFDDKMQLLDDSLDSLQSHVSSLRDRVINQTKTGVEGLAKSQAQTKAGVEGLAESQAQTKAEINELHRSVQQASKDAIEEMKKVLQDTNSTAKWMKQKDKDISKLKLRIKELEKSAVALTPEDLLDILKVNRDHQRLDLLRFVRADPDVADSQIALRIATDPVFRHWQSQDEPTVLYVETQLPMSSTRHLSGVALACSTLIKSFDDTPEAEVIYFFCGQHTLPNDKLRGPQGMMRSLISQLINVCAFELNFISLRLRQQLEKLDFRGLCECFARMISRLRPETTLFCVIDGIDAFERREWLDDCTHAINLLQDIVHDTGSTAAFLLLITSPVRTRHVAGMFPEEVKMVVAEEGVGRNAATERQMYEAGVRVPGGAREDAQLSMQAQYASDRLGHDGLSDASDSDEAW